MEHLLARLSAGGGRVVVGVAQLEQVAGGHLKVVQLLQLLLLDEVGGARPVMLMAPVAVYFGLVGLDEALVVVRRVQHGHLRRALPIALLGGSIRLAGQVGLGPAACDF